jgi:hypothetical protein
MKKIPYIVALVLVMALALEWTILSRVLLLLLVMASALRVLHETHILIPTSDLAEKLCYVAIISFTTQSIIILIIWLLKFDIDFISLAVANIAVAIIIESIYMLKKLLEKKYELFRNM